MEKTLESKTLYKGRIINLRLDSVVLENGNTALREVVEHPGAVGVIALKDNGDIVNGYSIEGGEIGAIGTARGETGAR